MSDNFDWLDGENPEVQALTEWQAYEEIEAARLQYRGGVLAEYEGAVVPCDCGGYHKKYCHIKTCPLCGRTGCGGFNDLRYCGRCGITWPDSPF